MAYLFQQIGAKTDKHTCFFAVTIYTTYKMVQKLETSQEYKIMWKRTENTQQILHRST